MNKLTEQIQAEVNKVVLGKEDIVRKVLLAILAQGHVLRHVGVFKPVRTVS